MLPKQTVPEGSRKVLNGKEVFTRRNFTTDRGNFFQTMSGDYILPNGEPVTDVSILESLPDPQRQEALAWWDQRFQGVEKDLDVEAPPAGRKMTKAELVAKARFLMDQAEMIEDEEAPELQGGGERGESEDLEEVEQAETTKSAEQAGVAGQPKDPKELKRSATKTKNDKGPSILAQMGINT